MVELNKTDTDTTIFRTTTQLKQHGHITVIIPIETIRGHGLIEGDMLDITITRSEEEDQEKNPIRTRLGKIKHIKKTMRELQETHADGKIYVIFGDLAKNVGEVGIEIDELEAILDFLKNCGDIIELPIDCWRLV